MILAPPQHPLDQVVGSALLSFVLARGVGVPAARAGFSASARTSPSSAEKQIPPWISACAFIDYLTGAFLIVAGFCFLLGQKTRQAATYLGAWIVLMVVVIYGPVLIGALADPSTAVKVEGLNYFADTLLFGGAILSLACVMPSSN